VILCNQCGNALGPESSRCSVCGAQAAANKSINPETVNSNSGSAPPAVFPASSSEVTRTSGSSTAKYIIIALLALMAGGAMVWLLLWNGKTKGIEALKISATASSVKSAMGANTYYADNTVDGKPETAWVPGANAGVGEWIRFDFDREITLHRIVVQPGYFKSARLWEENDRVGAVTAEFSDGSSRDFTFVDRMDSQQFELGIVRTKWVRLTIKSVYYGTTYKNDTPLSEVTFEWEP
jgi:hypothetical protein